MKMLKRFREKFGYTMRNLARRAGLELRRLSELECGLRLPSDEERKKLAGLGCNLPPLGAPLTSSELIRQWRSRPFELPCYPTNLWDRALAGREETLPAWFRSSTPCHSKFEADCWLDLGLYGAKAALASPLALGYRDHHLVDDMNLGLAERLRPCLILERGAVSAVIFPQPRLQTARGIFQLDGLILIRHGKKILWVNVEFDGKGHDPRRDAFRTEQIGLPVIRITGSVWDSLWHGVQDLLSKI